MNTAELLVKCLENEGVKVVFGIPGEENLAVMNALGAFKYSVYHGFAMSRARPLWRTFTVG